MLGGWLLAVSLALTPLQLRAGEMPAVNPWHGNNAVLPIDDLDFGVRARHTVISGLAAGADPPMCSFSWEPNQWTSTRRNPGLGRAVQPFPWEFELRNLRSAARKLLVPGYAFEFRLGERRRRADPEPLLAITNVVTGPVWVLIVDPSADSYNPPPLTSSALQGVRVISFTGGLGWENCSGWMTAAEAVRGKLRNFCGLPRAFANYSWPQGFGVIGLVLVPTELFPVMPPEGRKLVDWVVANREENRPELISAVEAARKAVSGPDAAAARNREDAQRKLYDRHLIDRKREGKLPEMAPPRSSVWQEILAGDHESLPFRVTGIIR